MHTRTQLLRSKGKYIVNPGSTKGSKFKVKFWDHVTVKMFNKKPARF